LNLRNDEFRQLSVFVSVVLIIVLGFSYLMFGVAGVRVVLGIIFISLPFYLILNKFELTDGEKFVFSILLGLTIFPSIVYLVGLVISFRLAIAITFVILLAAFIAIQR